VELCGFTYFAKHFQLTYYLLKRSILRASKRDLEREILITVGRDSTFFRRGTVSNCVADHCSDRHLEYNHLFWHALCLSLLYLKGLHQPLKQLSFFHLKAETLIWIFERKVFAESEKRLYNYNDWSFGSFGFNLPWRLHEEEGFACYKLTLRNKLIHYLLEWSKLFHE